ncbi:hypothetical protein FACS189434_12500 [Bacteroidia bacterium]|nr:hypothetical protein FACS189434_12500 [Bacteroidia bacterium]
MKRYLLYFTIFFTASLTAQNNKAIHSFNVWGQGGYSNLFIKNSEVVSNRGGFGGILGLGYGYKSNHFILEIGMEFDYKSSLSKYSDFGMQVGKLIDENTGLEIPLGTTITNTMHPIVEGGFIHTEFNNESRFVMQYAFTDLQDLYKIAYINVPLRIGGTFEGIYFLVGPKIGLNVLSYAETSGTHSSTGYFPQDIAYLSEMPQHSFVKNKAGSDETRFNGKLNLNLAVSAEVGINLILSQTQELRFAVFADYGVLNINSTDYVSTTNANGDFVYIPATAQVGLDPNLVKYNSLLTSNTKSSVNPFIAGLKVTMLFSPSECKYCPRRRTKWWER